MKNRIQKLLPLFLAAALLIALFAMPVSADSTVDSYPSVFHMKIDGTPVVGQTLTFSYDLYDPAGTATGLDSKLEWQVQDTQYIPAKAGYDEVILQTGGKSYTIGADAVGKYIAVRVPVSSVTGNGRMRTVGVGPILAATPDTPQAQAVTIESVAGQAGVTVGEPVEGHYLYAGENAEGTSEYSWALASSGENGTYVTIAGATEKTYIPQKEDMKKWLRFTVTPVDSEGNKGEPVHSVTRPIVGSTSYGAHVSGNGNCYKGMMVNGITNGIETNNGGVIYTYSADNDPDIVVDLGETRVLSGVRIASNGANPADGVRMFSSLTGGKTEFTPLHTADYTGDAATEELVLFGDGGRQTVDFSKPVQTRFIQVNIQKTKSVAFQELSLYEALPTGLTAAATDTLTVEQNMTEAEVREALESKVTVTAAYDADTSYTIPLSSAAIALDTTGGGTKDMTISYKGQTATVSVTVTGPVSPESITATKPTIHTRDLTVFTGAAEEEIRSVLEGVMSLEAAYGDGSKKAVAWKDVTLSLDTATAGDAQCTITYNGVSTQVAVKIADKKQPPNIYGLYIEGAPVAGETLTLHYTLEDPDGVAGNVVNTVKWHGVAKYFGDNYANYDTAAGGLLTSNTLTYTIPADGSLNGKYIDAAIGLTGGDVLPRGPWDRKSTIAIGPVLEARTSTPSVSTVTISSIGLDGGRGVGANIGQTLRGEYYYVGAAEEGESTYQWYSSSSETTGFTAIAGATQREYTVQESDRGKYLQFRVTPKDISGAAGTETESLSRPMAGNAAYLAMATEAGFNDTQNNARIGNNSQVLTNGISDPTTGGTIYTFGNSKIGTATIDLGKMQTLTGAQLKASGHADDTVAFYTSPDGLYWYPVETTESAPLMLSAFNTALGKAVTFTEPVQARYLQIRHLRVGANERLAELQAFVQETEPALSSIAATKKDAVTELAVKKDATAAEVKAYLAENVTVIATYAGIDPVTVVPEAVTYILDTSTAGNAVNATVSFRGASTTIPVKVEAPELTGITVAKAAGVGEIKVPLNTNAAGLKDLLADKIVITGIYAGGATETIANADAEYSATTSAAGTVNVTVTYGGHTGTVEVTVEARELTGITVTKAAGVTDINIWQNTNAEGLKTALTDKIVITANYSDNTTENVANADATYSADTSKTGVATVTVSYGGKTAAVSVNVQAVTLTGITVDKAEGVTDIKVSQGTDTAGLKTALADKIVITGNYSNGTTQTIANADANYSGNTSAEGETTITVSYGGQTATISVTVEAVVTLTGITVDKAEGVTDIKVPQGTGAAGLKTALADKIVITGNYSNGTTQTIANADATYSADTTQAGATLVTVTYEGKTATVSITVAEADVSKDVDPSLFGMRIIGSPIVGETLTFEYDLFDPNNKENGNIVSKISWVEQDKAENPTTVGNITSDKSLQKGTINYTITDASVGKYIAVSVAGLTGVGSATKPVCKTIAVGPILAEAPAVPTASSVTIIPAPGGNKAGCDSAQTMMGDYLYAGAQAEGESAYQWYIATNENGPFTAIEGATERTYTPTSNEWKKYLQFRVIPKDVTGAEGKEAESYNLPRVGNVAYRAHVSGDLKTATGGAGAAVYAGASICALTNGIYTATGGGLGTYGSQPATHLAFMTVDLGGVRTLAGAHIYGSGGSNGAALQISMTGEEGTFTPIHSADFEGNAADNEIISYTTYGNGDVSFAAPVTGRYVRVGITATSNTTINEIELFAVEDKSPVITLKGDMEMKLLRGETYVEPGYTATDEEDGDLTKNVKVTGTVDSNTIGTYEITYSVTDSRPQTIKVVRRVIVSDGYHAEGDLAYSQTVTADGENADALVDGNKFTIWQAGSTTSSAVIDLGSEQKVSNAVLIEDGSAVTGYVIEVSADGNTWKTAHTGTTIGANQNVDFEPVSGRYVRLRFTGAASAPKMATFEIRFDDLGRAKEALAAVTLGGDLNAVTEDLALPTKGLYGAVITWQSDNTAAVSNMGIVRRGSTDQNAVLTATVTVGKTSLSKEFPVTVLKSTGGSGNTGGGGGGIGGGRGDKTSTIQVPTTQMPVITPITPPVVEPSGLFKDVSDEYWAKEYIENLGEKGIVNGKQNGVFDAEGVVTRAEFLKMIVEIFGLQTETPTAAFTDVQENDWYYTYVATAATLGVAQGMGDGSFGASAPISRQDMAVLVARAAKVADKSIGEVGNLNQFTDAEAVEEYAYKAMAQLAGAGIISGDDKGALNPVNDATRAEAAKILCLVLKKIQA